MEHFEVNFLLRCAVDFPLQDELECCGVRLKVNNGIVYGTAAVDAVNREEARRKGYQLAEDVASALTLVFGRAFVVKQVNVAKVSKRREEGRVVIEVVDEVTIHVKVIATKWPRNWKEVVATLMKSLIAAGEKPEKTKRLMRVLKWWRAGDVDDDPLDKFLKFYIAFELLAAALGYRRRCNKEWARQFCRDFGISYQINEKFSLPRIRNSLVHDPGEEREEAERLAAQYAERFGLELLEAIRKALLQPSGPPVDASASKNCETDSGCGDQ
jgi:IS4 transposase